MRKRILAAFCVAAAAGMFAAYATSASAYPTLTSPCVGCHTGPNVPVTATLASVSGTNATYNVSATGATAIAVFDGSTKLTTINASSGSFTVAVGKTYTVYAVQGPTTSTGIGSMLVSPVAPPADTTAPVTRSDAKATYVSSAAIKLTATDNVGVTATYYKLDGGAQTAGTTISVATAGSHTLVFWSVDAAGNTEAQKTASFTITVPDTTPPVTTSDAKATYISSATIKLTATDNVGVAHIYYILDGAPQVEGTSVSVTAIGSHSLSFWSVDAAGNIEAAHAVTFAVTAPVPPASVSVSIVSSSLRTHQGRTIRLSGVVRPSGVAGQLSFYVQLPRSTRWVLVGRATVNASGAWTYSYRVRNHGTYRFQVRLATATGTVVSKTVTVSSSRDD